MMRTFVNLTSPLLLLIIRFIRALTLSKTGRSSFIFASRVPISTAVSGKAAREAVNTNRIDRKIFRNPTASSSFIYSNLYINGAKFPAPPVGNGRDRSLQGGHYPLNVIAFSLRYVFSK